MKITLNNFGSIKHLDFELKSGLTLLCGPNNTGKTYAAYAVFIILYRLRTISLPWVSKKDVETLLTQGKLVLNLAEICEADAFLKDLSASLVRQLDGDFDAPRGFFSKDSVRVSQLIKAELGKRAVVRKLYLKLGPFAISLNLKKTTLTLSCINLRSEQISGLGQMIDEYLRQRISDVVFAERFGQCQVLTAERAAINLFSRELSASRNNLVDQLLDLQNKEGKKAVSVLDQMLARRSSRYSLPIRKGLEIAEDLKEVSKNPGDFAGFAEKLESVVLGGQVSVGEYGELSYAPNSKTALRINLSASMVKSLASLVVYLRFQAKKGDFLIIDEPEMNLHPANQRKLAQFLCELVNAGLNVILSTHSDYIIREVNHAILLKHPGMDEVKARYAYREEQLLDCAKVSVLAFTEDGLPTQLEVDERGFAVDSIDQEISLQNQIGQDIEQEWQE